MIINDQSDGRLTLIAQTDHSHFVGQLAAHWGNAEFARPEPYDPVVRAACMALTRWSPCSARLRRSG